MKTTLLFIMVFLAGGCATITSSEIQLLTISVVDAEGNKVTDADCILQNDKGQWDAALVGKSSVFVPVRRSSADLNVTCSKDRIEGDLRVISRASGGMVGNVLFGGGIGALIDHQKGTGYNYPDRLPVVMGKSTIVDRHKQDDMDSTDQPNNAEIGSNNGE